MRVNKDFWRRFGWAVLIGMVAKFGGIVGLLIVGSLFWWVEAFNKCKQGEKV